MSNWREEGDKDEVPNYENNNTFPRRQFWETSQEDEAVENNWRDNGEQKQKRNWREEKEGSSRGVHMPPRGHDHGGISRGGGNRYRKQEEGGMRPRPPSFSGRGRGRDRNENDKPGVRSLLDTVNLGKPLGLETTPRRSGERKGPVFGFERLHNYLSSSSSKVLASVSKDRTHWKELLESEDLNGDKLIIVTQILGEKVCVEDTTLREFQTDVLTGCCSKLFADKLKDVIPKICRKEYTQARRNRNIARFGSNDMSVDADPVKVMSNLFQFCTFLLRVMPSSAVDYFSEVIECVAVYSITCYNEPTMELLQKFKSLRDQLRDMTKKKEDGVKRRRRDGFSAQDLQGFDDDVPPEDIKDIKVIPSVEELRDNPYVFLRPNKTSGAYRDSRHYLDVQFRLFREDFVQPLRNGIEAFLKERQKPPTAEKRRLNLDQIRVYRDVKIKKVERGRDGVVVYKLQLPHWAYSSVKWDKSKKLLPGCLILLSTEFNSLKKDTTFVGVVYNREIKELVKGEVSVYWEGCPPPISKNEENYLMFESQVYLEAYKYTLETLKTLELDRFPMKRFIVDASNLVGRPDYLTNEEIQINLKRPGGRVVTVSPNNMHELSPEDFDLDVDQFGAYCAAVTNEFTIIQGPPGTGKTYLGLKVAEVFLNNAHLWTNRNDKNPITVVCYTNHALDQFLEGILKYYRQHDFITDPDIIRIGGRCKSEDLFKFTLREVRKRKQDRLGRVYQQENQACYWEVAELEEMRSRGISEITGLNDIQGIVNLEWLSVFHDVRTVYPGNLWTYLGDFAWLGINDEELDLEYFLAKRVVQAWFKVRGHPKAEPSAVKTQSKPAVVFEEKKEEDEDENYDMEELMENRVVDLDDILQEAETNAKIDAMCRRRLDYLKSGSVEDCENSLNEVYFQKPTKDMTFKARQLLEEGNRERRRILRNRKDLLQEIFSLHKQDLLELPDVTDLLEQIKNGEAINFKKLQMSQRWALYFATVQYFREKIATRIPEIEGELERARRRHRDWLQHGDGMLLKDAKVVGLTTTGAAKYNNLLKIIGSKIVIVEEAAEVFEAHIVTCITEKCQQLILIGDHKQLRPNPTVFKLAKDYNLDLSLFERMVNNDLHCHQLKIQHRMRPTISGLIIGPIYSELFDDDSVFLYPDVRGVTKNVFFITHNQLETSETDSKSKSNLHEATFLAKLCRHFILQGYTPDKITVLTMYTGQMFLLKKEMPETCQGVRVTCVDNFQGEESDIILLSLVRNNEDGKIGFLSVDNRICVALSRAKHGLYVIGNIDRMTSKSKTWRAIKAKLTADEAIGDSLQLRCPIHKTECNVKTAEDFTTFAPEGGCVVPCKFTLPCSHECAQICHTVDQQHLEYQCRKPCLKKCANQLHPCPTVCWQPCPSCFVRVEKVLNCELRHKKTLFCHQKVEDITCQEMVIKKIACEHEEAAMACYKNPDDYICRIKVSRTLQCEHVKLLECNVDVDMITCKEMVTKELPCGHPQGEEYFKWKNAEDIKCVTEVATKLPKCGHEMEVACHKKDDPGLICRSKCSQRLDCGHACSRLCHVDHDPDHLDFKCIKNCDGRKCEYGHKCKVRHECHKDCPPCVNKILRQLPCDHETSLPCHVDFRNYKCQAPVVLKAPCAHDQEVTCGEAPLKQNCKVMVKPIAIPLCGHANTAVPCNRDGESPEELLKLCPVPCSFQFQSETEKGCDHQCGGTCNTCFQGRLHMKCQVKCGKELVCGHVCDVPCSAVCPPCQKPCLVKCQHSKCAKKCGEPCSNCKEKCGWRCPHKRCTKRCGEPCDRQPCDMPCTRKLSCGHDCVGFCGEPCPPLCRICNNEELTEIFGGFEDEEGARFVLLPDCGHTLEVQGLEGWLSVIPEKGEITCKKCPKCKTPIRNCRRFGNLLRDNYKDIIKVKEVSFGNRIKRSQLRDTCVFTVNNANEMAEIFPQVQQRIQQVLFKKSESVGGTKIVLNRIDEFSMNSMMFTIDAVDQAAKDLFKLRQEGSLASPHDQEAIAEFQKTFDLMLDRRPLSAQEVKDFNIELCRVDYLKQLMMRRSLPRCNMRNRNAYLTFEKAKKIVTSPMPFTQEKIDEFRKVLKELDETLQSGLGISEVERRAIVQAMGMAQGHWFKCPNGHPYVIGDCGGAMMESTCNECGARIGGGNHALRADNQLASEMDDAQTPAWPTMVRNLQEQFGGA